MTIQMVRDRRAGGEGETHMKNMNANITSETNDANEEKALCQKAIIDSYS